MTARNLAGLQVEIHLLQDSLRVPYPTLKIDDFQHFTSITGLTTAAQNPQEERRAARAVTTLPAVPARAISTRARTSAASSSAAPPHQRQRQQPAVIKVRL